MHAKSLVLTLTAALFATACASHTIATEAADSAVEYVLIRATEVPTTDVTDPGFDVRLESIAVATEDPAMQRLLDSRSEADDNLIAALRESGTTRLISMPAFVTRAGKKASVTVDDQDRKTSTIAVRGTGGALPRGKTTSGPFAGYRFSVTPATPAGSNRIHMDVRFEELGGRARATEARTTAVTVNPAERQIVKLAAR